MSRGAQLFVAEMRRSTRHPVDISVVAEHRDHGDMKMHLANLSAHGFMADGAPGVARGDRVIIRLPVIGRIEAYCMWVTDDRAGFQFERIIRLDDFSIAMSELQPNPRLRRSG